MVYIFFCGFHHFENEVPVGKTKSSIQKAVRRLRNTSKSFPLFWSTYFTELDFCIDCLMEYECPLPLRLNWLDVQDCVY